MGFLVERLYVRIITLITITKFLEFGKSFFGGVQLNVNLTMTLFHCFVLHVHTHSHPTHPHTQDEWVSMAVMSDGSYGMPEGVVYSFPIQIGTDRSWKVVQGLPISDFAREKMEKTAKELVEEKETALAFLQSSS